MAVVEALAAAEARADAEARRADAEARRAEAEARRADAEAQARAAAEARIRELEAELKRLSRPAAVTSPSGDRGPAGTRPARTDCQTIPDQY